jgi:thiol-disulfide isomerase/thioredoxin
MKVLMIGTPTCIKCKSIAPRIEEYCEEHFIEYEYMNLQDAPSDILNILLAKNIKQAPVFLIFKDSKIVVLSGDDIFLELESL